MKKSATLFAFILAAFISNAQYANFHDFSAVTILGDTISMNQYYGKKVMVVNTASLCAFTYQYATLESLYVAYHPHNFEIIGFPCDDFFHQEPGTDSSILQFCQGTYNINFQMMDKVHTVVSPITPIYQWLENRSQNGVSDATVTWNFNKFLIDEAGHWVRHFESTTEPFDTAITNWIMSASAVSGIQNLESNDWVTLQSANPANGELQLKINLENTNQLSVTIYGLDGKMAASVFNGRADKNQVLSYSTNQLASGVYLIKVRSANKQKVLKYFLR